MEVAARRRPRWQRRRRRECGRQDQATGVICQEDSGIIGNSELEDPDETQVMEAHEVHGDLLELHRKKSRFSQ